MRHSHELSVDLESSHILIPEVHAFLHKNEICTRSVQTKVDLLTRAVRSSLIPKKISGPDIVCNNETNCLGAVVSLINNAEEYGLEGRVLSVISYPWQIQNSNKEIHLVALLFEEGGPNYFVADPMPESGYSYGRTNEISKIDQDKVFAVDELIDGQNSYKILNTNELNAIKDIYYAETIMAQSPELALGILNKSTTDLYNVKPYLTRAYYLIQNNFPNDSENAQLWFKQNASPEHVRKSYMHLLSKDKQKIFEDFDIAQKSKMLSFLSSIDSNVNNSSNEDERNYWLSCRNQLSNLQYRSPDISWRSFLDIDQKYPLMSYEKHMVKYHPGYLRSNIYTRDWLCKND